MTSGSLSDYKSVFSDELRAVWPLLAEAASHLPGMLVGGTAVASHLRHRQSFDLDYMTAGQFDWVRVFAHLKSLSRVSATVDRANSSHLRMSVDGVTVDIFETPYRGDNPGHVTVVESPSDVAGLPVASLPDLFAMKLDVILYRAQLRDYIDITHIDKASALRIEDGLDLHMKRYGTSPHSSTLDRIVELLRDPGPLMMDSVFDANKNETVEYLAARVPDLRRHLVRVRCGGDTSSATPRTLPRPKLPRVAPTSIARQRTRLRPLIVDALRDNPHASYLQIAESYHASASYVSQIAREEGLRRRGG